MGEHPKKGECNKPPGCSTSVVFATGGGGGGGRGRGE